MPAARLSAAFPFTTSNSNTPTESPRTYFLISANLKSGYWIEHVRLAGLAIH